jgi:hypothetical protein
MESGAFGLDCVEADFCVDEVLASLHSRMIQLIDEFPLSTSVQYATTEHAIDQQTMAASILITGIQTSSMLQSEYEACHFRLVMHLLFSFFLFSKIFKQS